MYTRTSPAVASGVSSSSSASPQRPGGFGRLELMATISGYPLYLAYGFDPSSGPPTAPAAQPCRLSR